MQTTTEIEHTDFFEYIIPPNREPPTNAGEMRHLEQVAGQLLLAGYEGPSMAFYFIIYYLVGNPNALKAVSEEVRYAFKTYDAIDATSAATLPYLAACINETLRLLPGLTALMPVVSPGTTVDGNYIPKGVSIPNFSDSICQNFTFQLK